MYDVCFCLIRCDENGKFMETVAERVICLLSSGGHFDVLEGLCSHGKAPEVVILMSWKDYAHTERHRFHGRPRNRV